MSSSRTLLLGSTDSLELMPVTGERPRSPSRMKIGELLTFFIFDVGQHDVLQLGAVDRFEREAARAVEDHVTDGDGVEAGGALGAELDARGGAVAVGGDSFCVRVHAVDAPSRRRSR